MSKNKQTLKETLLATTENFMMKTIISIALCFGLTVLFTAEPLLAQQSERQIVPLSEEDYECLQQLSCVVESKELREKGWVVTFDETIADYPQERTAQLKGDNIALTARYDKEGNLLRGKYERQNVALPRDLLAHLAGEDFSGWEMTGNNMTVRDFNAASTVYNIILESEDGEKTVTFTHSDIMNMKKRKAGGLADNK